MRQLGKQGVDQPRTLGMTHGPVAVEPKRAEEVAALAEARQAMDEAAAFMHDARREIETLREDAQALWMALWTVGTFVREVEPILTQEKPLPDDVQAAIVVLHERNYSIPKPPVACPECVQGKHPNCTGEVLTTDDEMVECACKAAGHPL